jgi:hypothetical protein
MHSKVFFQSKQRLRPSFSKRNSEFHDPCQEAAERSHRCLQRNNFDKTFCKDYFEYGLASFGFRPVLRQTPSLKLETRCCESATLVTKLTALLVGHTRTVKSDG